MTALVQCVPGVEKQRKRTPDQIKNTEQAPQKFRVGRGIETAFEPRKVAPHVFGAPGIVASKIGDCIPIPVVRRDNDHRVMAGTPTDSGTSRIQNAAFTDAIGRRSRVEILGIQRRRAARRPVWIKRAGVVFFVLRLPEVVVIVPDGKLPAHRGIFGRGAVVARHPGNFSGKTSRKCGRWWCFVRIAAGFDNQNTLTGKRESCR